MNPIARRRFNVRNLSATERPGWVVSSNGNGVAGAERSTGRAIRDCLQKSRATLVCAAQSAFADADTLSIPVYGRAAAIVLEFDVSGTNTPGPGNVEVNLSAATTGDEVATAIVSVLIAQLANEIARGYCSLTQWGEVIYLWFWDGPTRVPRTIAASDAGTVGIIQPTPMHPGHDGIARRHARQDFHHVY